ncbi:MAG: hypothetical protein WCY34_01940, partial [Candidatus Omnitrophota bacterium]
NVVEYTANYITEAAKRLISHEKLSKKYTIWLKNASIEIRGLGVSPSLLNQKTSSFFPFTRKFKQ